MLQNRVIVKVVSFTEDEVVLRILWKWNSKDIAVVGESKNSCDTNYTPFLDILGHKLKLKGNFLPGYWMIQ